MNCLTKWSKKRRQLPRKRRNPNGFTTDEAQTATLLVTEGSTTCRRVARRGRLYRYPLLQIGMCDRQALEPTERVFGTKIMRGTETTVQCPSHLFPPDGKGRWWARTLGTHAERVINRLDPLLTAEFKRKWQQTKQRCK